MWRGCAKSGEQHLHLLLLRAGGEEWRSREDFEDEASQTPDVNLMVVGLHEDDLGRTVVAALDVGELLLVEEARRAEVNQLHAGLA
jgi:hypothetical protein